MYTGAGGETVTAIVRALTVNATVGYAEKDDRKFYVPPRCPAQNAGHLGLEGTHMIFGEPFYQMSTPFSTTT